MSAEQKTMFIKVEMTAKVTADEDLAKKLAEVCPVNIFGTDADGRATIVEENLDECVLCDLCVQAAPAGGVRVVKLYSGEALER